MVVNVFVSWCHMRNEIEKTIFTLCSENGISELDIKSIQNLAIKMKLYNVVVYLNNNVHNYIAYVKNKIDK